MKRPERPLSGPETEQVKAGKATGVPGLSTLELTPTQPPEPVGTIPGPGRGPGLVASRTVEGEPETCWESPG